MYYVRIRIEKGGLEWLEEATDLSRSSISSGKQKFFSVKDLVWNYDLMVARTAEERTFTILTEARVLIEAWRNEYNQVEPHSALNYRPPAPETIMPVTLTQKVVQLMGVDHMLYFTSTNGYDNYRHIAGIRQ